MCLLVDEKYAGRREGRFFKNLAMWNGGLHSPWRRWPYPAQGQVGRIGNKANPTPNAIGEGAYHVFLHVTQALNDAARRFDRLLVYVVEARQEDFVAGGWWGRRGDEITAGFLDLNVIGPYTGND